MENQKESLFRYIKYSLVIFVVLAVYCAFWGPAAQYGESLYPARTISVAGEGQIVAQPDIANVIFAVVSEGSNPATVQENNSETMNKVLEFVKGQGVDEKDIKTSGYNLSPRYSYNQDTGRSYIYAYELNQTVTIKVRDLDKVGDIVGGLGRQGINQIQSVSFDIDDSNELLTQAREKAFKDAEEKAKSMATASGTRLGKIVNFSESGGYPPVYYSRSEAYGLGGADSSVPKIEPGSQEVTVQVNVTYQIK